MGDKSGVLKRLIEPALAEPLFLRTGVNVTIRKLAAGAPPTNETLGDEVFFNHFFNALSIVAPMAEVFLIESITLALPLLAQLPCHEALRGEVAKLLKEETAHQTVHHQLNTVITAAGVNFIPAWRSFFKPGNQHNVKLHMAFTAAAEALFAVLAHYLLLNPQLMDAVDPRVKRTWQWHAKEEIEHRSVAFDLYQAIDGGWARRSGAAFLIGLMAAFFTVRLCAAIVLHERHHRISMLRSATRFVFGRSGALWHVLPRMARYLLPRHHPSQLCTEGLEEILPKQRTEATAPSQPPSPRT